ncbi:prepilin peptidase [Pantoea sp. BAV 3049]|uniref:A24 family peptidase n=1 Tax=Pantoea sp. BAV 3049 TaxID=2654188 RepID=UPI00131B4007|nr:prepilin peptidase [Pantoea sp. BAV 3049]
MLCSFYLLFISLLVHVCYSDIRYRKIKNLTTLILSLLALVGGWQYWGKIPILPVSMILVAGFLLSIRGYIGAGDVKLMAGLSLSLDADNILVFIFLTTLAGLPVALIMLLTSRVMRKPEHKTVPYGVAIVGGYLATVMFLKVTV